MGGAEWEHECTNGQIGESEQVVRWTPQHPQGLKEVEALQQINPFPSILHHHDASVCAAWKFNCEVIPLEWIFFSYFITIQCDPSPCRAVHCLLHVAASCFPSSCWCVCGTRLPAPLAMG